MANPTETEIRSQLTRIADLLKEFRLYGAVNAENYLAHENAVQEVLEGNYTGEISAALTSFRAAIAQNRESGVTASLLLPILKEYARFIDVESADLSASGAINTIEDYFVRQSISIQSRQITYVSPAASSANVGNGVLLRLRMDADGVMIENEHVETKVARCTADAHSGTNRHEEVFTHPGPAANPRDSLKRLSNPSFSDISGTDTVPTAITGWAVSSAAGNFIINRINFYRDFVGDSSPAAIGFETNDTLTQNLNARNVQFAPGTPVYCQIAWNAQVSSATGNLTLRLGTASSTVTVTGATGWNILRITIGSSAANASNAWYENFNRGQNTAIQIVRSGAGGGSLLVDDVILTTWAPIDGSWYVAVGGQTHFRLDDRFSWTDTEIGAVLQRFLWEGFNRYLRHANAGPTITDP